MQEDLLNNGMILVQPEQIKPSVNSTIIVLGVARSGTTMVAACLQKLGLFLGGQADNGVLEDLRLSRAMEKGTKGDVAAIIEEYNAAHDVWGFKRPEAFLYLDKYLALFRNPKFVIIYRDPVAIAKRNAISIYSDFFEQLEVSSKKLGKLTHFARSCKYPQLIVSYEKALFDPDAFVAQLNEFVGLETQAENERAAVGTIENGPNSYLNESRLKFQGSFDLLTKKAAFGWVRRMPGNVECEVEISCEGEILGFGPANIERKDLMEKKIGPRAFSIYLSHLPEKGEVIAKVKGTPFVIPKSPQFRCPGQS